MTDKQLPIIYRPHPVGVFLFLIVAPSMAIALYAASRWWFEAPVIIQGVFAAMAIFTLLNCIHVLTSSFAMSESGIKAGYFFGASGRWDDIDAWTRWGANGSLFIRFKNGKIVGTGGWAFHGDRIDRLEALLLERVGKPALGDAGVAPRLLKMIMGNLPQDTE